MRLEKYQSEQKQERFRLVEDSIKWDFTSEQVKAEISRLQKQLEEKQAILEMINRQEEGDVSEYVEMKHKQDDDLEVTEK